MVTYVANFSAVSCVIVFQSFIRFVDLIFLLFHPCDDFFKGFGGFVGLVEPLVDRCEEWLLGSFGGLGNLLFVSNF